MSTRLQIDVQGGTSDRTRIELVPGTPVEPFSIGSSGSWVINGPGVAATHAYLYFDGTTLFVACAPGAIVRVSGGAVTTDWKPLAPPCDIQLGNTRLVVQAAGGAAPAVQKSAPRHTAPVNPPPLPAEQRSAAPARDFDGGYDDDAPTQYQPMPAEFAERLEKGDFPPPDPRTLQYGSPAPVARDSAASSDLAATIQHGPAFQTQEPAPASERTRVLPPRDEPEPAPAPAAKPERPAPPSVRGPESDGATVVQPLEEFLAKHKSQPLHGAPEDPDTKRRPLGAPLPAAGAPPPGKSATGGFGARSPESGGSAYAPPHQPGGAPPQAPWGAAPGYQPPPNAGNYPPMPGAQPLGMPGMPGGMAPGMPGAQQGPMPGMPGMQPGASMPPGVAMGGPYPGAPGAPQGKKNPLDDLMQAWKSAPLPRKITYLIAPFAIIGFFIIFFSGGPAPKPKTSKGAKSGKPPVSASVAMPQPPPTPPAPPPSAAKADTPPPEATETAPPETPPAPTASAEEAEGPPKLAPGELTKQRKAVDAVAAGDFAKAIEIYDELAKENPDNPVYKTAADTLRKKIGAGGEAKK